MIALFFVPLPSMISMKFARETLSLVLNSILSGSYFGMYLSPNPLRSLTSGPNQEQTPIIFPLLTAG